MNNWGEETKGSSLQTHLLTCQYYKSSLLGTICSKHALVAAMSILHICYRGNTNISHILSGWYSTGCHLFSPYNPHLLHYTPSFLQASEEVRQANCPLSSHTPHSTPEQTQTVKNMKEKCCGREKKKSTESHIYVRCEKNTKKNFSATSRSRN